MKQAARKISARHRRVAAVHEAGHVVVARRFGLKIGSAWIAPNDGPEERTWVGRVEISTADAPEIACQMVGMAGSVAERLWQGESLGDYWLGDLMSDSDLRLAGCPLSEADEADDMLWDAAIKVEKLFERGNEGWQELITEARRLIVDSRVHFKKLPENRWVTEKKK
jgi:hypothetical protein